MTGRPRHRTSAPAPPDGTSFLMPGRCASTSVSRDRTGALGSYDRTRAPGSAERGSASVVMVALIGVIVSTTAGALVLAGVVRASHQARLGADLSAVAAALELRDGGSASASCAEAARIASANGTSLQACSVSGSDVTVVVAASSAVWPQPATARARAGPETSPT